MKIYTKTGDKGKSSLFGGKRVEKHHIKLESYGSVDELNSHIGLLRSYVDAELNEFLIDIQKTLFNIGSHLATPAQEQKLVERLPKIEIEKTTLLEKKMDLLDSQMEALTHFVLPGGDIGVSHCHIARTVCRRAERKVSHLQSIEDIDQNIIIYLNRLSDFLFILARYMAFKNGTEEIKWIP